MITRREIIQKIKKRDFSISYEDAIDLIDVMSIEYFWVHIVGGNPTLSHIELTEFGVYLKIQLKEKKLKQSKGRILKHGRK